METWFVIVLLGSIIAGIPAFCLKVAAAKHYPCELFILTSAGFGFLLSLVLVWQFGDLSGIDWLMFLYMLLASILSVGIPISNIYALRVIDTTIYYPLSKVIKTVLLVLVGIGLFGEYIDQWQLLGLGLALVVGPLLVNRSERQRQSNLAAGLVLVVITSVIAAVVSSTNKYTSLQYRDVWVLTLAATMGVLLGSVLYYTYQRQQYPKPCPLWSQMSGPLVAWALLRAVSIVTAFGLMMYAYTLGASLIVASTVYSLSMVVPIVLSVWWFGEHWNTAKLAALVLTVLAVGLLQ